ncbi:MAG TPA: hypothetical protein VNU70_07930 [Puia sp.]|nr:hypothetical protein [Puia sp.]
MNNLKIATAEFEHASGDKKHNLSVIRRLAGIASDSGADAIAFHECSITGNTFARHLSKQQLLDISEYIPGGQSIETLTDRPAAPSSIAISSDNPMPPNKKSPGLTPHPAITRAPAPPALPTPEWQPPSPITAQ